MESANFEEIIKILKHALRQAESLKVKKSGFFGDKNEFLINMCQRLRKPICSILGVNDLLKKSNLDEKQIHYLQDILTNGAFLLGILDDILDISMTANNKLPLARYDFELEHLIYDAIKIVSERVGVKSLAIDVKIDNDVHRNLDGDPTRLRQIFVRLLSNAVKFCPHGDISVIVSEEKNLDFDVTDLTEKVNLRFIVKDNGIGIPKDKLSSIFESFRQIEDMTSPLFAGSGSGLGLTVCKSIIEVMGGKIWAESDGHKGSEFIFTLPFNKGTLIADSKIVPSSIKDLTRRKVFIVDDSEIAKKIIQKCCETLKMDILCVETSALSALKKLDNFAKKDQIPDLLLCDIRMPHMDGFEFVKKIRAEEKYKFIKIVAISSDRNIGIASEVRKAGFNGFIPKPVFMDELAKVITTVLGDKSVNGPLVTRHMAEELICKGIKILLISNSIASQELLKVYFDALGCNVSYVNNANEALKEVEANKFDMCFMDMQTSVGENIEAAKIIKTKISKTLPIIALITEAMKKDEDKYLKAGIDNHLKKPINILTLKKEIIQYGKT